MWLKLILELTLVQIYICQKKMHPAQPCFAQLGGVHNKLKSYLNMDSWFRASISPV